ncbi:MAG: PD-(D/E)XK nuclease family protein, partial [Eggerthella sp.]|nr:PD-(D/E)XK nuclease family protein [Eggerthella sp.]
APAPLVLAGFDDLDCAEERMTAALAQRTDVVRLDDGCRAPSGADGRASELQGLLERLFKPAMPEPLRPTGRVRFLLPAGRYAAPTLVASTVAQAVADERLRAVEEGRDPLPVAVTARDPRALFDDVAGALLEAGAASAVSASRAFADTAFGRAFLALHAFACGAWSIAQASDFALGPFSGIGNRTACELDAAWRGDRTVERARIAADLARESEAASDALTALEAGDVDGALAGFEARLRARADLDPAFRAEQLAAVSCARRFASACSRANAAFVGALPLLERMPVSASARSARDEGARPDALFMSLDEAAELPACSCAALVLCDLDAGSYPVRLVEDGGTLLLEKLGLGRPVDALAASRRRFFRALSSACETVVCERVLNTEDASEAYPSVMFEE